MQTSVNTVVRNIFNTEGLQELTVPQLREYIRLYPYSSIGHLLLARKKKEEGSAYSNEAAKAALYINNPLWLHCFLTEERDSIAEEEVIAMDDDAAALIHDPTPITETVTESLPAQSKSEQVEKNIIDSIDENNEKETVPVSANELTGEPVTEISLAAPPIASSPFEPIHEIVEQIKITEVATEETSEKKYEEKELIFEPYHTIDYFASQGIKLKASDLTNDRLGRQLKSFTEWLRSMKKVTSIQSDDLPPDSIADAVVQKNAEESVETSEVETEAMAEVWAKQGKTNRAVAIYRKLSLLNPAKSHYFAAKIEQLNN